MKIIHFVTRPLISTLFFLALQNYAGAQTAFKNDLPASGTKSKEIEFLTETALYTKPDSASFHLYLNEQWAELARYCEGAIEIGYDPYYIRVRLGVAYYELKQYDKAEKQFEGALVRNGLDNYSLSYLYSCYLANRQYGKAQGITRAYGPILPGATRTADLSRARMGSPGSATTSARIRPVPGAH
jgi:tetratricopeptide (TPR) repeat protein